MKKFIFILPFLVWSCIGEDIVFDEVEPVIKITNPLTELEKSTVYQLEFMMTNNIGMEVDPDIVVWQSSDLSVLTVDENGLITAQDYGMATIELLASIGAIEVSTEISITVTDETIIMTGIRSGLVSTTSSYVLTGEFELEMVEESLVLSFDESYQADNRLPGLYVYLSNNPNSSAGAFEIGEVTTFNGTHSYTITDIGLFDYQYVLYFCKPFNVKVGHGEILDP